VPDAIFDDPRLASVYDPLDPDRSDLDLYTGIATEIGARSVVDIGCGTGDLACLLAAARCDVIGVDPAGAMLDVARRKPGAELVRWVHGIAADLPDVQVDLVTMTGNVAQVFLDDDEWQATLAAAHRVLRPAGVLVFETRRPEREAWKEWNPTQSHVVVDVPGVGVVETWNEVIAVELPFVTFEGTIVFHADGHRLVSRSTLRFRTLEEIERSLGATGLRVRDVRDAPDRPDKEHVVVAERR
jgi:ubiquinone/menaquinone biosynthesis C-methylase UbiE